MGDKHIKVLEDQLEISSPTKRKFICTCFSSTVPFYVAYKASIMAQLLAPVLPSAASGPLCSGDGRENCLAPTLSHCSILWHPMLLLRVQDLPFHGVSFARFFKVVKISFHVHQLLLRSQRGSPAVLPSSPKRPLDFLGLCRKQPGQFRSSIRILECSCFQFFSLLATALLASRPSPRAWL